uniref:Peptidase A1 domain-containing protein n=1 Tax=Strongyloides papillosus TaxID=174720 RepID=A0A0N5C265_STREA
MLGIRVIIIYFIFNIHIYVGESYKDNVKVVKKKYVKNVMSTKTGFRIQFDSQFFFGELNEKYQSEVAITAYPLSESSNVSTSLYFPETDSKINTVGSVNNCLSNSWYYLCAELSSSYRDKKVIGSECGLYKTLSNTGDLVTSTLKKVDLINIGIDSINFNIVSDIDFPIEYNFFLENKNISSNYLTNTEAKIFYAFKEADFVVSFTRLKPRYNYGRLCILEKPLISGITIQGRPINSGSIFIKNCYFSKHIFIGLFNKKWFLDSLQTIDYTLEQETSNCVDENNICLTNSVSHLNILKIILLWIIYFITFSKEICVRKMFLY